MRTEHHVDPETGVSETVMTPNWAVRFNRPGCTDPSKAQFKLGVAEAIRRLRCVRRPPKCDVNLVNIVKHPGYVTPHGWVMWFRYLAKYSLDGLLAPAVQ